jgi:hypothetical protein
MPIYMSYSGITGDVKSISGLPGQWIEISSFQWVPVVESQAAAQVPPTERDRHLKNDCCVSRVQFQRRTKRSPQDLARFQGV